MLLWGDAHKQLFISPPSPPDNITAFAPSGMLAATHRHYASPVRRCPALPPFASWLAPLLTPPAVRSTNDDELRCDRLCGTSEVASHAALVVQLAARRGGGESNGLRLKVDRNR